MDWVRTHELCARANMGGDSISHIREIYILEGTIKDTEEWEMKDFAFCSTESTN